jgi:hydroxyacylglutathione hydrolase
MAPVTPTSAAPERLEPRDLGPRLAAGATLIDLRDPPTFGAGHIAGSLNVWIESPQFAERVTWFAPPGRPLVLLGETERDVARACAAFARIGLDGVDGYVVGTAAIRASGLAVAELPNISAVDLARRLSAEPDLVVLDVREPVEWEDGHVPGARHIPMRQIADRLAEIPRERPVALVCRGGPRSSTVGSLLLGQGFSRLLNVWGGMGAWAEADLPMTQD